LREGDANTRLFHAVANGRRTKNYIASVRIGEEIIADQEGKVRVFTEAYERLLGTIMNREHNINLEEVGLPTHDLQGLDGMFSEAEVWGVVKELLPDRAPGPDGFVTVFYQKAWHVVKGDVMADICKLAVDDGRGFGRLNTALITLIPKKQDA
jgi:mannosylglycoprotein endo-beta-mannosidase